ncbi:RIIA lysis inhibitor [Caulobacter phage CcrRogue]|uniref:Putative rIIa-like protein n=1 Tax=Caulobacter phage CcrRogue TaxID=2927986 RepID=K4JS98_9CAUD|nr:RIIA lysis inhibitor [Caulobacter phage CcrRogue]AFU86618.1 putative rIIa-like protein [Caulobacter phage CcrRogue]
MRLATEPVFLETIGVQEEQEFKIKASGKAFRMLIDGLYSDKIGSLVREICSNAQDAHIVAGYPGSFFVHVPSEMRPEFYVRDYGPGMDHAKVMHLYSTLFESDKDETDDLTGAFGLGSKSPFAYTSQFALSCYDGDVVRHYTAAIGKGGVPRVMLQGTEDCSEPAGVRVTVAVNPTDFASFERAVKNVAMGFIPMYDSNIDLGQPLGMPQYEAADGTWAAYENSALPATWNVRQGCAIYPLAAKGGLSLPHDNGRKWLITVPMGTVEPIPSREEIQYKPEAVKALQDIIGTISQDVEAAIWVKIKDIQSVTEFFATHNKLRPPFISSKPKHPATGLESTTISFPGVACLYKASFDQHRERWGYRIENTLDLSQKAETHFLVLRDISDLLDPSRDDSTKREFSQSETRRLARILRLYLESKNLKDGVFMLGYDRDKAFWNCALPTAKFEDIDVATLKGEVPRRDKVSKDAPAYVPPIRGLALAKRAGEQMAVTGVETFPAGTVAWVSSDQYRKKAEDVFVVANKYGIKHIYIASPTAQKHVEDAKVPTMREAIDAAIQAKHKVSLDDCVVAVQKLSTSSTAYGFYNRAIEKCPADFDRLTRMKSSVAAYFGAVKPLLAAGLVEWTERERSFIKALYEVDGQFKAPPRSELTKTFEEGHTKLNATSNHPIRKFLDNTNHATSTEQVTACTKALEALIRTIPLTLKFGSY